MAIDWQKLAQRYRDAYLADLKTLVGIDSSRDDALATADYPLGPGPAKALIAFLDLAKRDGFMVKNLDNLVGYVEYGTGDQTLAILGHADVMPAGKGWATDPFELTAKDGNLYGRGTSDDKGPALAAYYGLKMLKDQGIDPKMKIRFIVGTDEESDWTGMNHYLDLEPAPTLGFSPDAEFPLINGEKGNVTFETHFKGGNVGPFTLQTFDSGLRMNMVPRDAEATVTVPDPAKLKTSFEMFLAHAPVTGDLTVEGTTVHLQLVGKAAHGMEPKNGINAGTYLATFLGQFEFGGDAADFLHLIANDLHDDSRAHRLGLNYTDDVMGDLTMNVGIMTFKADQSGVVNTNFRYPTGTGAAQILAGLQQATAQMNVTVEQGREMVPHYVDPSDPIVATLMDVYRQQTGDTTAQPEVVGGGTYGRLMKRGVAFGALFPGTADTMHQANEFQPEADLLKAMAIYGQATYELTK
ncbi:dipeptidase PepV [Levilactobacillus zymae]|uniref:Dipeptidase PepV n=1 Tax=Levilactobacillus zymae TaxID=267363 RepID=A0ABQ0WVH2_9LACO|nr:dipeptidase PepV [Levilactobacillus zymae]KRL07301.1 dipeptidase PepV [Levilactobacillus zymae DSM 19395]QFR60415.1 dipeptidase PepV [Levilactobacillus zymae]GEO71761.1 dipeptidase PepV [Levilactobacillus zymae]